MNTAATLACTGNRPLKAPGTSPRRVSSPVFKGVEAPRPGGSVTFLWVARHLAPEGQLPANLHLAPEGQHGCGSISR